MTDVTVISGVVDGHGAGGVKTNGSAGADWTLQFALEAWRAEGGDLVRSKLAISGPLSDAELRAHMDRLVSARVVALKVRHTAPGRAELLELLEDDVKTDPELLRCAAELLEPTTRRHELFGVLTLDRRVDWYEGTAEWMGARVTINIAATEDADVEAALRSAAELWREQGSWNARIRRFAVERLLDLKNSTWLEEDEGALSAEAFESRMTLDAITVSPDGSFEFWHDDGDLFWGHSIQVSGSLAEGPTDADIPG